MVSGDQGTSDSVCWPMRIELLAEVAAAMDERDRDHGGGGVGGGAEGVSGEHAQTTGVGGQGWGEGDLHGEVRDGARGKIEGRRGDGSGGKSHALVDPFLIRFSNSSVMA